MVSKRLVAAAFVAAISAVPISQAYAEADAESLVNALNAVFGKHDGVRAAHTHGICVKGNFVPTAEAASLTKAPHFNSKTPVGVVGRFSMGGGDPNASNAQKDNVRGIALHFDATNPDGRHRASPCPVCGRTRPMRRRRQCAGLGAERLHGVEALAAALEQDADEIDHRIGVAHRGIDRARIAQVGLDGMDLADPAHRLQMPS